MYRRFQASCRTAPLHIPAHTCRLPQRLSANKVAPWLRQKSSFQARPQCSKGPHYSYVRREWTVREQTLWSGFWASMEPRRIIACGRFRLVSFSCPFPPRLLSYPLCQLVFLSLDLKIVFNKRCYIAVCLPHAVQLPISSLFSHWFFQNPYKSCMRLK